MEKADVVLVDWNMPEMDGLAFVRAVRADVEYAGLPVMMVTTNTEMASTSREALEAGRQRIHHEAVHRRHDPREARAARLARGVAHAQTRLLIVDDSVVDPPVADGGAGARAGI